MYNELRESLPIVSRFFTKIINEKKVSVIQDKSNLITFKLDDKVLKISYKISSKNNNIYYHFFISLRTNDVIQLNIFNMDTIISIEHGFPNAGDQIKFVGAISEIINRTKKIN